MKSPDYPILTERTVPDYLRQHHELKNRIDPDTVTARELGDGNLNLVFVCNDDRGASLTLKQSMPYVRAAGPSWPLTPDRSRAEATGLTTARRASPATTPELYAYDHRNHVLAMEDLSRLTVWRSALNDGLIVADAAANCGRHLARLFFHTGMLGLQSDEFRRAVGQTVNAPMCGITEDLIFTQPYLDHANNRVANELCAPIERIRADQQLLRQVARLKREFMTRAEALVHGDLHTGSVMVDPIYPTVTKVIDPEFCFYGPVAFDLGVLLGNFLFATVRATCLGRDRQRSGLAHLPVQLWSSFEDEFWSLWPERVQRSITDDHAAEWLNQVRADSIGFGACETIRRIVGFAKVADIETLPAASHVQGALLALEVAHTWLSDPASDWSLQI